MKIAKGSYCIVASTLPVGFMAAEFEALRIRKIFVMSKALEESYRSFGRHKDASIEVVRVPESVFAQAWFFLGLLLRARLSGVDVVFFHECCLPVLDLLVKAVRPRGYYLPQVSMSSWQEIDFSQFPSGRTAALVRRLGVADCFRYYRSAPVGGKQSEHVLSIKAYPDSIVSKSLAYSRDAVARCRSCAGGLASNILFITGKSAVADERQQALYVALMGAAHARGYVCHVKDHPNPVYRLNLQVEGAVVIDPQLPAELLETDYHLVVGVSSSALLNFDGRSVSLLNLLEDMPEEARRGSIQHFEAAAPGNRIKYIHSIDEFVALL